MGIRLFQRQPPPPEPKAEDALNDHSSGPVFGLNRYLDLMAMQYWIVRQQRDMWEFLARRERAFRRFQWLWLWMAFMWLIVAMLPLWEVIKSGLR